MEPDRNAEVYGLCDFLLFIQKHIRILIIGFMNDMFTCVKWCTPDILSISSFPGDKTQLQ